MNDKTVTHEDLPMLRKCRAVCEDIDGPVALLFDRLIAAAEADQPPLPEGWYWVERGEGRCAAYVKDGLISPFDSGEDTWGSVDRYRNRLTPLRLTVTEAEVEKVADIIEERAIDMTYADLAYAVVEALGIEVKH